VSAALVVMPGFPRRRPPPCVNAAPDGLPSLACSPAGNVDATPAERAWHVKRKHKKKKKKK